jgi:hypothetical protein
MLLWSPRHIQTSTRRVPRSLFLRLPAHKIIPGEEHDSSGTLARVNVATKIVVTVTDQRRVVATAGVVHSPIQCSRNVIAG